MSTRTSGKLPKGGGSLNLNSAKIPPDKRKKMKNLIAYYPNTIQNALTDFDRYLESFLGDSLLNHASRIVNHLPVVDIHETGNDYVLNMELPGYDEKNIDVHVDGSNLTIASKEEEKKDDETEKYILREIRRNSFSRSFKLPENADPEAVSAGYKNGILTLNIKKRAEAQKKTIQINAA
jgi:HSP20 family protein